MSKNSLGMSGLSSITSQTECHQSIQSTVKPILVEEFDDQENELVTIDAVAWTDQSTSIQAESFGDKPNGSLSDLSSLGQRMKSLASDTNGTNQVDGNANPFSDL